MKICTKCLTPKPGFEFGRLSKSPDGLNWHCKECVREYFARYRKKNYDKLSKKQKEYNKNNKEKVKQYKKQWFEKNKDKIKAKREDPAFVKRRNELTKERRKNDKLFAVKQRARARMHAALKNIGFKKSKTTKELLGCDYEKLVAHLERQFTRGMSWENRGDWQIDHVVPLSSASTPEEMESLFHYTNLRPIWAEDNRRKNDKREFLI